uniref:Uncharacterized protein n=1 Tax=Glossina austeni TaxID=7395 RepID=A0A1A9UPY3_GLOAU
MTEASFTIEIPFSIKDAFLSVLYHVGFFRDVVITAATTTEKLRDISVRLRKLDNRMSTDRTIVWMFRWLAEEMGLMRATLVEEALHAEELSRMELEEVVDAQELGRRELEELEYPAQVARPALGSLKVLGTSASNSLENEAWQ